VPKFRISFTKVVKFPVQVTLSAKDEDTAERIAFRAVESWDYSKCEEVDEFDDDESEEYELEEIEELDDDEEQAKA
jgi:hypothetical protein